MKDDIILKNVSNNKIEYHNIVEGCKYNNLKSLYNH